MKNGSLLRKFLYPVAVILIVVLICWDYATTGKMNAVSGTYRAEADFDVVTGATTKVAIVPSDYSGLASKVSRSVNPGYEQIEEMVKKAIELQGGFAWIIKPGDKVMIKPNIVEKETASGVGTNTDVRVVKALIKIIHDFTGGNVEIIVAEGCPREGFDNPDSTVSSWKASGYQDLKTDAYLQGINFRFLNLNKTYNDLIEVDLGTKGTAGPHNYKYMVHKEELSADVYISVPVLKIHDTGITSGLKNQIGTAPGCYYGYNKMKGTSYYTGLVHDVAHRRWTTEEIVDLSSIASIDFVVVDAIMCLQSQKTYNGKNQLRMNTIIAGADPVAVDHVCARLFCQNPDDIAHITLAEKVGLGTNNTANIIIAGAPIDSVKKKALKNQTANGKFGQSNRTWLLSKAFSGTDITKEYIENEASLQPIAGENDWSQPYYFFDDRIDLLSYYNNPTDVVSYAFSYFTSPKEMQAELWIGSDEAIYVYINGTLAYSYTGTRTYADADVSKEIKKVNIREGQNSLLVKTVQRFGDYSFALNICEVESNTSYAGNRVEGLKFSTSGQPVNSIVKKEVKQFIGKVYPNPLKTASKLEFTINKPGIVKIDITDVSGKFIGRIANNYYPAGKHTTEISGEKLKLKPGIWFCNIIMPDSRANVKFIVE